MGLCKSKCTPFKIENTEIPKIQNDDEKKDDNRLVASESPIEQERENVIDLIDVEQINLLRRQQAIKSLDTLLRLQSFIVMQSLMSSFNNSLSFTPSFQKKEEKEKLPGTCSICMNEPILKLQYSSCCLFELPCGHWVHEHCLNETPFSDSHPNCPECWYCFDIEEMRRCNRGSLPNHFMSLDDFSISSKEKWIASAFYQAIDRIRTKYKNLYRRYCGFNRRSLDRMSTRTKRKGQLACMRPWKRQRNVKKFKGVGYFFPVHKKIFVQQEVPSVEKKGRKPEPSFLDYDYFNCRGRIIEPTRMNDSLYKIHRKVKKQRFRIIGTFPQIFIQMQ
jgi:hypothetical protein